MIHDETVRNLMQISTPRNFKKDEYICFEGQPGTEMYVVLKGCVGVYVVSALCTFTEAARIMPGDFFGEMAIFDKLPRSASCVALEDTACIAINSDNLGRFISACPEIAEKMLINMSERIRRLNDKLYKSKELMREMPVPRFALPKEYAYSHDLREPERSRGAADILKTACPVCGKEISLVNIKPSLMNLRSTDSDRRAHYAECDPLWYYVQSCPHCHYSNYYPEFFKIYSFNVDTVRNIIKNQHEKEISSFGFAKTPFDRLFVAYMQAIHINMNLNPGDNTLMGRLWLYLYWLFTDAGDKNMKAYCCSRATDYLVRVYDGNENFSGRQSLALTLANLFLQADNKAEASRMCNDVLNGSDQSMRSEAYNLKNRFKL